MKKNEEEEEVCAYRLKCNLRVFSGFETLSKGGGAVQSRVIVPQSQKQVQQRANLMCLLSSSCCCLIG